MNLLKQNLGWKLFSLVVSALLWSSLAREPELGAFVPVPVEYKGMPDEFELSSDPVGSVSLDIRGPADKITNFSSAKSPIVLDFSTVHKPGEKTFQIGDRNVDLPSDIRLVRAVPAQIRLQFEPRTTRDVPVQVRFAGTPQKGYQVARYHVTPQTLTIVGPESRAKRIEYAVTDPIDLAPVVGTTEFHVNSFVGDPHVRFLKPARVSVAVTMEKK